MSGSHMCPECFKQYAPEGWNQEMRDFKADGVREGLKKALKIALFKAEQYETIKSDIGAPEFHACLWWIYENIKMLIEADRESQCASSE